MSKDISTQVQLHWATSSSERDPSFSALGTSSGNEGQTEPTQSNRLEDIVVTIV